MVFRSLVLAYHGCDASIARHVAAGETELRVSQNKYDWLGNGIYFWEDSPARALRWAKEDPSGKIKTAAVLGAIIDLGNCLNLIEVEHLDLVKAAHRHYLDICSAASEPTLRNEGKNMRARYLDCVVLQILHKLREKEGKSPFDAVRAFFVEGESLYENSGLRTLDHVQICVRNPEKIIGYFLPREKFA